MRNNVFVSLCVVLAALLFQSNVLYAQCTVSGNASSIDIVCGETVSLSAVGDQEAVVYSNPFSDCPGAGWQATSAATCSNPCGPGPDGTAGDTYLWMGNGSVAPRTLTSIDFDLSQGGTICFDMKYAPEDNCGSGCPTIGACECEGPDGPTEGVHLEFSKNGGATWLPLGYWDPLGGCNATMTTWTNYCRTLNPADFGPNIRFRWIQKTSSSANEDHWGIDNVTITKPSPSYTYDWGHDAQGPSGDSYTPDVTPTSTTTYNVTYAKNDGSDVCTNSVTVNVRKPAVTAYQNTTICPGEKVKLDGDVDGIENPPTSCGVTSNLSCKTGINTVTMDIGGPVDDDDVSICQLFDGQSGSNQILYTKAELINRGLKPGKITSLGFFIESISLSSSWDVSYAKNFSIKISCTNRANFECCDNDEWINIPAANTVYSANRVDFQTGWFMFNLDKAFEWDGNNNIVVEFCFKNPDDSNDNETTIVLRANDTWNNVDMVLGYNTISPSISACRYNVSYESEYRPQLRFEFCEPYNPTMTWLWESSPVDNSFNPNSSARDPEVSPTQTTTYTLKAKTDGAPDACYASDNVIVTVQDAPETPIPSYNVGLCEGDALNLLFGTTALPAGASYAWTGPGGYTATVKNPTRGGATPAMNGTYSVVVSSSAGCPSLAGTVDVVVNPAPPTPTLGSNSPLCDGEDLLLTSSLPGYIYSWTGPTGFTSNAQNPTRNDPAPGMNGQYSLELEDPTTGCKSLNPTNITVVQNTLPAAPNFSANKLTLCPGEDLIFTSDVPGGFLDPDFEFTFMHLESAWTNTQTGNGTITATRTAVTAAEAGTYGLIIKEVGADCASDTAFIEITIFDPGAFTASNTGPYCVGEDIELTVTDAGTGSTYSWTGPGGYTANTKDATRAGATVAFSGVYDVAVDNGVCSNPFTVSTTVTVVEPQDAGADGNDAVCINSGSIDLFTLLGGTPDAGGTWSDDDGSGNLAGSNFNPLSDGTFHFTYTLAAIGTCPESKSIVTIVVEPMPYAGEDGALTVCNISQNVDLNSILGGTPDAGGVWTNLDGAPAFNATGSFNPNGATAGDYNFEYTVSSTSGLCPADVAKVTVTIEESPNAGTPSNATICEDGSVDLTTLLAGNTPGGTWSDDNASGQLTGTVFSPNQSGVYRFTYTTPAGSTCASVSSTVTIVVDKLPNAGTDKETSICEDGGLMDLFSQLGGNPESTGTWTNLDGSSGYVAPDQFDPSGLGGNTYRFEYEVPASGTCAAQTAIVTVSVLNEPNSGTAVPATICYETVFDLYDALSGYDAGGVWSDDDNSRALESSKYFNTARLNESTLPRTYHFTYTLNAQGCIQKQTTVEILVNKPANPGEDTQLTYCQVFGDVVLIDVLEGNPETTGVWTELNGTSTLNIDRVNTTTMAPGVYVYQYNINSPTPCDPQSSQLEITILEQPSAGNGGTATICSNDVVNLNAFLEEPFTTGGVWSENSDSGGDLNSATGRFDAVGIAQGTYTFNYTIPANNGCDESTSQLTLDVLEAPSIINLTTLCSPDRSTFTVSFDIVNGDAGNYSVNQPGTVTGSSFTSDPIPSGSVITFTVSDGGTCGGNSVEVDKSCDCTTQGQSTNTTPLKICDATTATAPLYGTFVNDSNDVQMFYLHRGASNVLVDPIDSGATPTFEFDPLTMHFDTVYYISAVVGNDLNGYPDVLDDCFQVSLGTPVQFFEGTSLNASLDKTVLCPGDVANLTLNFTGGKSPYTIKYRENGYPKTWVVYTTDTTIVLNPSADVSYRFNTLLNANGCSYALTDVFSIDVNTAPTASITNIGDQCAGDDPKFFISVDGDGTLFDVVMSISGHGTETISGISKPGIEYVPTFLTDETAIDYSLQSVTDNSNSICPGQVSGLYTLYPNPTANITTGTVTICEGTSLDIPISTFGIGPFDIVLDDGNGNITNHSVAKGVSQISMGASLAPGTYSFNMIAVTDQAFGCQNNGGSGTYNVTINPGPRATVEALDQSGNPVVGPYQMCEGDGAVSLVFRHTQGSGSSFVITYMENGTQKTTSVGNGGSNTVLFNPNLGTNTITITKVEDDSPASCAGTGNTITIQMNPKPVATLSLVDPEYCDGEDVFVHYSGNGVYPINAEVLDASNTVVQTVTINSVSGGNLNLGPLPVGSHTYSIGNITDGSGTTCSNTGNSTVSVTVLSLPTASFVKNQYTICDGESVDIGQLVTGIGTVSTSINDGVNSYLGASSSGNILTNVTLPAGSYTFSIDSVYDNSSAGCVAYPSDQTTLLVQALPTVNMAWSQSPICENMPVDLIVTANGNGPFVLNYSDTEGNNYTENIGVGSTLFPFLADKDKSAVGVSISDNTINENGNACTADITNVQSALDVLDRPEALIYGTEKMCFGQSANIYFDIAGTGPFTVEFIDNESGNSFTEIFNEGVNAYNISPLDTGIYSIVRISDSSNPSCDSTGSGIAQINVITNPNVDFTTALNDSCSPFIVAIEPQIQSDYALASCLWDLGNGVTYNTCATVENVYTDLGSYDVSLQVTSVEGCSDTETKNRFINIHPDPIADFDISPSQPTTINSLVQTYNKSSGASIFNWTLDNSVLGTDYQPFIQLPIEENAMHTICLEAITNYNCRDMICKDVKVKSVDAVFIPNTFTPDGDNINEVFLPSTIGIVPESFHMEIFNRWGELVFETFDLAIGWDGTYKGENAKSDMYTVLIHVSPKSNPSQVLVYNGLVTLLK
tara:strand:- start:90328 stop:98493 length:8166 start_codon:yes stop_codon:yes gene_type:complete